MVSKNQKKPRRKKNPYVVTFIDFYSKMALNLGGFRLPVPDPVHIEGDYDGRTTAVIFLLGKKKSLRMSEVSDLFGIHPSTATVLVDKWVDNQLVKRCEDKKDRRVVLLQLAEKGEEVFKKIDDFIYNSIQKLFSNLSEEEQGQFLILLGKMVKGTE